MTSEYDYYEYGGYEDLNSWRFNYDKAKSIFDEWNDLISNGDIADADDSAHNEYFSGLYDSELYDSDYRENNSTSGPGGIDMPDYDVFRLTFHAQGLSLRL